MLTEIIKFEKSAQMKKNIDLEVPYQQPCCNKLKKNDL